MLSDDTKRREYDTYGATSEQMGMGNSAGQGRTGYEQAWNFRSTTDPEELFRKIFGENFKMGGSNPFDDFAESAFGFGGAQEVK